MASIEFFNRRVSTDDAWMFDAACSGLTDIFFPPLAERPQSRLRREAVARTVCSECRVLETCRAFARELRAVRRQGAVPASREATGGRPLERRLFMVVSRRAWVGPAG